MEENNNNPNGATKMNTSKNEDANRERMLNELRMELAHMVEAGDLTDMQANEWYSDKADQWAQGLG